MCAAPSPFSVGSPSEWRHEASPPPSATEQLIIVETGKRLSIPQPRESGQGKLEDHHLWSWKPGLGSEPASYLFVAELQTAVTCLDLFRSL